MKQSEHNRPQNQSCPAGGTKSIHPMQRGVIVAPPSGNTDDGFTVLHQGFDTLTLSIKASLPPQMFDRLEAERERAEQEAQPVAIDYNGVPLLLRPHGGMGYRFNATGGRFGATWSFKKPNAKDPWGVRVNFGSDFLAHLGIGGALAHLESAMDSFGMRYHEQDISLARVDYCVDVLAPDFALVPEHFVMHSSTGRRDFLTGAETSVHGRSGRVTSVTVGSVRNRQVIIYDKREEVMKRGKVQWWDIWNQRLREIGRPEMSPKNRADSQVWRIELRAGKDLLKDRWNIRTFRDFFARFGDLVAETTQVVRYATPTKMDKNRARWPNHAIWNLVSKELENAHLDTRNFRDPDLSKEVNKQEHISVILRNLAGLSVTLAALKQVNFDDLSVFLGNTKSDISELYDANPEKYAKMLETAKMRYRFR